MFCFCCSGDLSMMNIWAYCGAPAEDEILGKSAHATLRKCTKIPPSASTTAALNAFTYKEEVAVVVEEG